MLEGFSYDGLGFSDSRGKFPEPLRAQVPLGTRAKMKRVATAQGITCGEVVRRALSSYLADEVNGRANLAGHGLAYAVGA